MAIAIKIEVRAIYEDVANPSQARITQRDSDLNLATTTAAARQHFVVPDPVEYLTPFGGGAPADRNLDRRGKLGWVGLQRLLTQGDGDAVGLAIFNRLNTRSMKAGSYVQVFPVDPVTEQTGAATFKRSWPAQPDDTL